MFDNNILYLSRWLGSTVLCRIWFSDLPFNN